MESITFRIFPETNLFNQPTKHRVKPKKKTSEYCDQESKKCGLLTVLLDVEQHLLLIIFTENI